MDQPASHNSESTSWHTLNADRRLTKFQRVLWIGYNLLNNSLPHAGVDRRIQELKFRLTENELDGLWDEVADIASPARRLCDLFWMSLPWRDLSVEMQTISIVEMGCGTGVYGRLLENCLGEYFAQYLGVDIQVNEEWQSNLDDARFSFEIGRANDAEKFLPGSNLIITQSALEHFEEDLSYFIQVAEYVSSNKHPILQVHLLPPASCISTFPWHGIREYTPRTISKITRLFGAATKIYLFGLGGPKCNQVHRNYITLPILTKRIDLRHEENRRYRQDLRPAMLTDFSSTAKSPSFYALMIASNFRDDPFVRGGWIKRVSTHDCETRVLRSRAK